MCLSGLKLSPLGQTLIGSCSDSSQGTSSPDMDVWGPSSVTEACTSIMHTFVHCWRNMEYIIVSLHRTTPKRMGKLKWATEKLRIFLRRSFDQMGNIGLTSFVMLYERIEQLTRHPSRCLRFNSYLGRRAIFQPSLSIEPIGQSRSSTYL